MDKMDVAAPLTLTELLTWLDQEIAGTEDCLKGRPHTTDDLRGPQT